MTEELLRKIFKGFCSLVFLETLDEFKNVGNILPRHKWPKVYDTLAGRWHHR